MSEIIQCDRCKTTEDVNIGLRRFVHNGDFVFDSEDTIEHYDLCDGCLNDFLKFMEEKNNEVCN